MARIPIEPKFQSRRLAINLIEDNLNPTIILPPLYMQVNPQNLKQSFKKKTNRIQTIGGFVEQYWGDELDTMTVSASTGGFVHPNLGYTNVERTKTTPYFKFQDILDIYRNNGNTYDNMGRVVKRGSVIIFFDPGTYLGYFDNFEWSEDASSPFKFLFSFTFKVERSYTGF
jgi:hypothetical protein